MTDSERERASVSDTLQNCQILTKYCIFYFPIPTRRCTHCSLEAVTARRKRAMSQPLVTLVQFHILVSSSSYPQLLINLISFLDKDSISRTACVNVILQIAWNQPNIRVLISIDERTGHWLLDLGLFSQRIVLYHLLACTNTEYVEIFVSMNGEWWTVRLRFCLA